MSASSRPPSLDELRGALREAGLRATPARMAVLARLRGDEWGAGRAAAPISHPELADALASHGWDRVTIYRNLVDLTQAGLARRTDIGDHVWRFEATRPSHGSVEAHPHFVCNECGTVQCVPESAVNVAETGVPGAAFGRAIEIQLKGVCVRCQ